MRFICFVRKVEQHMSQFNATWQLHNKYLFCCVIFNEPVVQKCLPEAAEIIRFLFFSPLVTSNSVSSLSL